MTAVPAMMKDKTIHVVVPCYNEETQVGTVIDTMPDMVDKIIVVDDCSTDRTREIVKEYEAANDRIVLIFHERNLGVGGAIASGYEWARDNNADVAVVMAGDGQMPPADLPAIVEPVVSDRADYTKGNRLVTGEAYRKIPKVRYFGNAILSLLTKIASGYWHIADSQSGYTAINRKMLEAIDWKEMYRDYGQPNDLLVRLNVFNARVCDVETEPVYNIGEKSGIRIGRVVLRISGLLTKLFLWRLKEKYIVRDFHPLVFFYLLGFTMIGINVLFFFRLLIRWNAQGQMPEITLLIWLFSFSMGLMSWFFAMWFDMESNKHLQAS